VSAAFSVLNSSAPWPPNLVCSKIPTRANSSKPLPPASLSATPGLIRFDSAIAAARTCYAPRLIGPEEITDKQRTNIGAATFYSGHHTVYQHAHFEFGLENISRQFVWSFLHAHPFYNSEQQSQRYVRLDRAQAYVPPESLFFDTPSRTIYEHAVARAWQYYREISSVLLTDARDILNDIWHISPLSHPRRIQKIERSAEKRAIEIARYVSAPRRFHYHGAHRLRHRLASPLAHERRFRYP